ncbi:AAA family ATPase [Brevibacillus fluminis]|uniref:AAA family ATPase n=1 Tax=Brevibacillus fluminis TaxID=511487 RepID=UPI003F886DEE
MKPIQLQIAGLHSYRDQVEIDFETLCAAGLFGIFGPTGSGKSTILDAITLALYGQVVRAGGTSHPQESLNQHEQRLFVSFTFELGLDRERKRYTIEREFGLDKKGKKRQPEVRLIERATDDGADIVLESKATTATQAVEQLLGLTLNDFTRAVVLPQGQFSKFLTLKGSERNEMLQRIFQLHEYGEKLGERIRRTVEQNKEAVNRIEKELAALGDAGPDALAGAEAELAAAMEQAQRFTAQRADLEKQKAEQEQLRAWQRELGQIEQELLQLDSRKQEMDSLQERSLLIEAALHVWPQLEKVERLLAEHVALGTRLDSLRAEKAQAEQAHEESERRFLQSQAERKGEEPLLLEQKGKLAQALEWEQELVALKAELVQTQQKWQQLAARQGDVHARLGRQQEQLAEWFKQREGMEAELRETTVAVEERKSILALRELKQAWERELARTRQLEAEAARAHDELDKQTEAAKEQEVRWKQATAKREELAERIAAVEAQPVMGEEELASMRDVLQQMRNIGKEWRELGKEQEEWAKKRAEWEAQRKRVQAALEKAEADHAQKSAIAVKLQDEKARLEEELQKWRQHNMARVLREHLHDGQECPVCGSVEHPRAKAGAVETEHAIEQEGQAMLQRLKAADTALKAAEQEAREAEQRLQQEKVAAAVTGEREAALTEEQRSHEARLARIRQECRDCGERWTVASVDDLLEVYQEQDKLLRTKTEERVRRKQELDRLMAEQKEQHDQELAQQRLYERLQVRLEQARENVKAAKARWEEADQLTKAAAQALHVSRKDMPIEAIEPVYAQIEERDRRQAQLVALRSELEPRIQQAQANLQSLQAEQAELEKEAAVAKERIGKEEQLWNEKHQRWHERTGGAKAADCLAQVESKLTSLQQAAEEAEQAFARAREERQRVQEALVQVESSVQAQERQLEMEKAALADMLQATKLQDNASVMAYCQERDQLPAYREAIRSYQTRIDQLHYDAARLQDKLGDRVATEEEYQLLCEAWEALESQLLSSRDRVAVSRQTLTRIQSSHERWLALHADWQERIDELSRLEELRKLFEGKAFVQFIAEEKLASIARDASYHLMQMTKNRYALELGDGGEFVLRDEAAGGIRRAVSTLSGGETFLTSLALALALSVEIQMRGAKLEFFFLDEGFGTLDPELLEVVLHALERLRMNDLTIGIISHVPELRVRMPRRLIVTPPEPLGAGSQIHVEME